MSNISSPGDLADFPASFKGAVFRPGDDGYAAAKRLWNARRSDQMPALIARAADPDDVVVAVGYAAEHDLTIAVRSGGHGVDCAAMADGALVVDLSGMKGTEVDPETGRATIEAGVLLGEMDAATQEHGLVVPAGTVSDTGAAGLALGGGIGHLTRSFGATVDNLLSIEAVTVDGRKLTVSADSEPDLFWGMRGAGHNLVIATSLTFQAHPVGPAVMSGVIVYPAAEAVKFLAGIDAAMTRAPRELSIPLVMLPAPPLPGLPQELIGTPILLALVIYTGPPAGYEEAMGEVGALAEPVANLVKPSSWLEANSLVDPFEPTGRRYHSAGGYLPRLDAEVAKLALERLEAAPPPTGPATGCMITFPMLGGAIFDRDEDSTAFSRVGAEWLFEAIAMWDEESADDAYAAWAADTLAAMWPRMSLSGYVNLTADRGPEWLRQVYGGAEKWERIVALKRKWDPENRLAHNKNVLRAAEED
ncbi:MAG: FAD-binding oxidoreductase [Actinobacteria bacterium]|nr:FAD-binding oxidoreductase [Actinomycetota bacterium]